MSRDFAVVIGFIYFSVLTFFEGITNIVWTIILPYLAMSNDPVQQIKEEEAKSSQKIEELTKKHHTELDEYRIKKEKELEQAKEDLREKGQESLAKAKQEAMTEFKKITEDEDRQRSTLISTATSKKDEAVNLIVQAFEKQLT